MKKKKQIKRRRSLANKLAVWFAGSILLVTIVIGIVFTVLFQGYTEKVSKEQMKHTALSVSTVISNLIHEKNGSFGDIFKDKGDFLDKYPPEKPYTDGAQIYIDGPRLIRSIKEITDAEVWLVDSTRNIFTTSHEIENGYANDYLYEKLPENAKYFINRIFADDGYDVYGESFSEVFNEDTLTMGVPIYSMRDGAVGAVLLHSPKTGMTESFENGLLILLASLGLALIVGTMLSIIISRMVVKPLGKINQTALKISEGEYAAKTNVSGNDEIGELAQTMDEMGEKLQKAEQESLKLQQMRQDFVANISHELRTPVTVIRGSLEALCDGVVNKPEMVEEYHSQLLKESIYMQRMVNDLLDLSRLQNPDFSININEFNLYDCISDAVRSGRRIASEKSVNIEFEHNEEAVCTMFTGDYDRIRQMILIILDNAIKFTDNKNSSVKITFKNNTLEISNVGEGISQADLPYVFDRFYKSRSEQNKNGTGLGLAIAKQIAIRHDIDIKVDSVQKGLTTFTFVFPKKI